MKKNYKIVEWEPVINPYSGFLLNMDGSEYKDPNISWRINDALSRISYDMQQIANDSGLKITLTVESSNAAAE